MRFAGENPVRTRLEFGHFIVFEQPLSKTADYAIH